MRLGTLLLIGAALVAPCLQAQGRPRLPWEVIQPLGWQVESPSQNPPQTSSLSPSTGDMEAQLTADGTLSIRDARGLIRLQTGLPGRPLQVWRDGGLPVPQPSGRWAFPSNSPLSQGLGTLQWCAEDFRPFLAGLLWILEDGEHLLTVVHPATAQVVYLPLPPGRDLHLTFLPDRLEVSAGSVDRGAPSRWSLPWMGLLPRLAALGPQPVTVKPGSALAPFPKD